MYVFIKCVLLFKAVYRGFWVRRKLQEVIKSAKYVSDEEDSMEEDIDLNITDEVSLFSYALTVQIALRWRFTRGQRKHA